MKQLIKPSVHSMPVAVLAAVLALAQFSCGSGIKPPETQQDGLADYNPFEGSTPSIENYMIRRGDGLSIRFLYNPELNNEKAVVRADGKITLQIIGDIEAVDRTAVELAASIRDLFQSFVEETSYGQALKAGDELELRFTYNPQLNQRLFVRPDGKVSLLMLGVVQADGIGYEEFEEKIREGYREYIREPVISVFIMATRTRKIYTGENDVTVQVTNPQPNQVFVGGEVEEPTVIEFQDWLTPLQALSQAGGWLPTGNIRNLIYITRGPEGEAVTTKIDLSNYMRNRKSYANLFLRHGDILIVPRSGIAKLGVFVEQYLKNSLPVQSYMSFSYTLNKTDITPEISSNTNQANQQ